jgi:hypothetical protein
MTRRIVVRALTAAGLATVVLSGSLLIGAVDTGLALDAYVLVLGAILLLTFVHATRAATAGPHQTSALEAALRRTEPPPDRAR